MTGSSSSSSSRGRRLPMIFMLLAIVVAMAVAIGVGLAAGGMAVAKKPAPKPAATTGATIQATSFEVAAAAPNYQTGDAHAKCPGKKQRALGGGVVQIGPPINRLLVHESGPLDSTGDAAQTKSGDIAKQWYASVVNDSPQSQSFKVFAICSARSDATIEAKSFQVPDTKVDGAWAVCPPNKRALGGGVLPIPIGASSGISVVASSPLDSTGSAAQTQSGEMARQWIAFVRNEGAGPQELKVFAICSARSDATIEAAPFSVAASGGGFGTTHAAWAVCPANKLRALGGGVFSNVSGHTPSEAIDVTASGPLDDTGKAFLTQDGDMARQWYTTVNNYSDQEQNLKVFAICE